MNALKNDLGFTLIEFMVAALIMMVGLLGLLQSVNMAITSNMSNQLRDMAVAVADQELTGQLSKGFTNVSTSNSSYSVQRKILNGNKEFTVARSGNVFANSKQVSINVSWTYKNVPYSHNASSVITSR